MKLAKYLCAICVLSMCGCSSRAGQSCADGEPSCGLGEYCKLPVGDCGGGASGVCEAIPDACLAIVDPVCGCDGLTYDNECTAALVGMSVAHEGKCDQSACCDPAEKPGADGTGSCIEGVSCCSDGLWECNAGDGQSICAELGEVCEVPGTATPGPDISSAAAGKVVSPR